MPNLQKLLQKFAEADFDFVIVGGFAGVLHGSSYVTDDLDICAALSPENIGTLRSILRDANPVHRMTADKLSFMDYPAPSTAVANLYLETDIGVVDVLGNVLGLGDYNRLVKNSIEVQLGGHVCRVVSLPDLITAKEAVGREKDLLVVKELRAIAAKRGIDVPPPAGSA